MKLRDDLKTKTNIELNALKNEVKNLNEKLSALTDEELAQVTGGLGHVCPVPVEFAVGRHGPAIADEVLLP